MAPQYFTIFQCPQTLEFTVFPMYEVPTKPGNFWYLQYTEYCDRMGAEPL